MPVLPSAQRSSCGNATSITGTRIGLRRLVATMGSLILTAPLRWSGNADVRREPLHERLALAQLVERHPLVRLGCLRDVSRAAEHRRYRRIVEYRCFAAERHLSMLAAAACVLADGGDFAVAARVESGQRRELVELDRRT